MTFRQGELSLDAAAIRSIWEDSYSPSKSYGLTSPSRMSFANNSPKKNYSAMLSAASNGGRSPTAFGPVGSPLRKKSLGTYDCSAGSYFTSSQSSGYCIDPGSTPKRSSTSSLWDYSSGYSSRQPSPLFSSGSCSEHSPDLSPPPRGSSSSLFDPYDQLNSLERDQEKQQLKLIAKAISSLLMTRGSSIDDRVDTIRELFSLTSPGSRRASVAASGGQFLERERHSNVTFRRSQLQSEMNPCGHPSYPSLLTGGNRNSGQFSNNQQSNYESVLEDIEHEAKMRRTSAYQSDTSFTWKGALATSSHPSPSYATKVFVGGLPYDISSESLTELFGNFGLVTVQFPPRGRGHAYLVFDNEQQVQALLNACENKGPGQFFFWVSSRRGKNRQAQVIPWATEDSDWLPPTESNSSSSSASSSSSSSCHSDSSESLSDPDVSFSKQEKPIVNNNAKKSQEQNNAYKQNTVFVGALHGEITAEGLQNILSELFGPVVHVGIDTDKCRYPSGSARVTFKSEESFRRAVVAEFVQVVTPRFSKTIQLDAYIEDGICSECKVSTPVFCRFQSCFCYYCPMCFEEHRRSSPDYHPPVMRNRNSGFNNVNTNTLHASSSSNHSNNMGNHNRLSKDRSQTI